MMIDHTADEHVVEGRVVEVRLNLLVIQKGVGEMALLVGEHDAQPGDYVLITADGYVDVVQRASPERLIHLPMSVEKDESGP